MLRKKLPPISQTLIASDCQQKNGNQSEEESYIDEK